MRKNRRWWATQALLDEHRAGGAKTIAAYKLISLIGEGAWVWCGSRSWVTAGQFARGCAPKLLSVAVAGRSGEEPFKRDGATLG